MSAVGVNFVFCPPPLGKPDPTEPKPEKGPDNRRRVIQLGSKDNTCSYAVYNLLRERWKAPNTNERAERRFERSVSSMRKAYSEQDRSLPNVANQLNHPSLQSFLCSVTKRSIGLLQGIIADLDKKSKDRDATYTVPLSAAIPGFIKQKQYLNMYEYLKSLKLDHHQNIYSAFFKEIGEDPKALYESLGRLDPFTHKGLLGGKSWEQGDLREKNVLLEHLAWNLVAKRFGFKISSWGPRQPFASLVKELQVCGPLIVGGCFGRLYYSVEPRKLGKSVMNREVYGWKRTDPKNPNPVTGHVILLIGTENIRGKEFVYYIDPDDPSDPAHPEKQFIFCMSYERLTGVNNLSDRYGGIRNDSPSEIGYALYRATSSQVFHEEQKKEPLAMPAT